MRSGDEVLLGELPVDGAPEGVDEGGAVVLVVDVVGVLPDVAGEDGLQVVGQRRGGVVGLHDLELARVAVLDEPGPAGAEVADGRRGELLLELLEGAERGGDLVVDAAGGLAAAGGRERLPEEGVVPDLGGEVEDGALLGHDHLLDGLLGELGVGRGGGVELCDVALVVLVVVEGDLLLGDALGRKIAVAPRKRRDAEERRHIVFLNICFFKKTRRRNFFFFFSRRILKNLDFFEKFNTCFLFVF
jgi:hypothetical protein